MLLESSMKGGWNFPSHVHGEWIFQFNRFAVQQNFWDQAHSFQVGSVTLPALCVVVNVSIKVMPMDQGLPVLVRPQPVQYE